MGTNMKTIIPRDEHHHSEITTNGHRRDIILGDQLTAKERQEFDYYTDETLDQMMFVRYKDWVYDLAEAERCDAELRKLGWEGQYTDSAWTAVLVKYPVEDERVDTEQVVMGYYIAGIYRE
jgi:hypothetical protein